MSSIHVIGLGPGSWSGLPLGSYQLLQAGDPIFLRTQKHPVVQELSARGISFAELDEYYEREETFEEVYSSIVERLIQESVSSARGKIIYAVPGHPGVAEKTVSLLREKAPLHGVTVHIGSGHSFLDELLVRVGADPIEGMMMLDAISLEAKVLNPSLHTVLVQLYSREVASDVKLTLMEVYPDEYEVTLVRAVGIDTEEELLKLPLYELDYAEVQFDHLTSLYLAPTVEERIQHRQISHLLEIVRTLRSPEGCPWDRKQTHQSLRKYVLEEAFEVADAIDRDQPWDLMEELGDLLLQVALHGQIASETGDFTFADIVGTLSDKLVRRHPHVFGSTQADTSAEVIKNWEEIKQLEKQNKSRAGRVESLLDSVKPAASALQIAYQLQEKAAEVGFDWPTVEPVIEKIKEETEEVKGAQNLSDQKEEVGDLLFAACNLARFLGVNPEEALAGTNLKFRSRFQYIETELQKNNRTPKQATLGEMDLLWEEAKKRNFKST